MGHRSVECPFKENGMKCFRCNEFGHRSFECQSSNRAKPSGSRTPSQKINLINETPPYLKRLSVENVEVTALIDTGSKVNLVKQSICKDIGKTWSKNSSVTLNGFGNSKVQTHGSIDCTLSVDNEEFTTEMQVVPDKCMDVDVIIGKKLLCEACVTIDGNAIHIAKRKEEMYPDIMTIGVSPEVLPDIGNMATGKQMDEVKQLISTYQPNKIKTTEVEMKIITSDDIPVYHTPRRLPFTEREIVEKQVDEWLREGIVEPCASEYSSQVVVVKKKDGTPRICIDYRKINKKIVKDRYPLPLIEDQLDRLQGARVFSILDLRNGFFHVNVEENSKKYTSFVTHSGQFRFNKVPFGMCTSPSVFQRFINQVFRNFIKDGIVLPYMDDLIIPAINEDEALERLKACLNTASEYGLEINFKKCRFLKREVEFLGHVIKEGQIYPSPDKTKAVLRFPQPTTQKQLQSFLGLTGYFRKFIPGYSRIALPLSDLLKRDNAFKFGESQHIAFKRLKEVLANTPVLRIFKQGCPTEVHCDASKEGFGAVLLQKAEEDNMFHPVYFMSKKTSDAERKYSSYELEVLAVVEALKKFRVYLLGCEFKIITDCAAFNQTMRKRELGARVARWALYLEDYSYEIIHRSGSAMRHVDALSRNPVMLINTEDHITTKIKKAQEGEEEITTIKQVLKTTPDYENYFLQNDVLYKLKDGKELLVIPRGMQREIIKMIHEKNHMGKKKTEDVIQQEYYIQGLHEKVERCLQNCIECILTNRKRGKQEGLLNPLPKEGLPLHTFHVDHLGPLESTNKNYKHILAVIDSFTKFVWLYPTKSTTSSETINKLRILQNVFGNPEVIISDKGTAFTSDEFNNHCKEEGIKHHIITTGLPRANGQIERLNSVILSTLTKLSIDDPTKWYKYVDRVQNIINSTSQQSTSYSPFELLFGTKMRRKEDVRIKEMLEEEMHMLFDEERNKMRDEAKKNIQKVQNENRRTYNLRRRPATKYYVDDVVAIKRTQQGPGLKLKSKYMGPYKVVKVKPKDTYDVVKLGVHEGPASTTTCAEYIKYWPPNGNFEENFP